MNRPLNISPAAWEKMMQRRGSTVQLDKTAAPKDNTGAETSSDPLVQIDQAVDGLVANTKRLLEAVAAAKKAGGLKREETMSLDAVKDLVDTAIAPYLVDIIKELEVFEGVEA